MDNETLVYNSGALEDLSNTTNKHLQEFQAAIEAMFKIINTDMNQPDHWSGEVYDQLKDKCNNFRASSIDTMESNLKAYVDHFHKTSEESEATTNSVKGIVTRDADANKNVMRREEY